MDRLLTSTQIAEILGMTCSAFWKMVEKGKFPQPIRYNRMLVRWKASVVREWRESKLCQES